jgi:hypothetical protein
MKSHLARRWRPIFLVALTGFATGGWSQVPSTSQDSIPAPTIRLSTHLVLVDVVVTDKQGNAITGLGREDFAVEENGKSQKISTFVPAGQNAAGGQSLPPGIYSNRSQTVPRLDR